jgi:hypothetical protein
MASIPNAEITIELKFITPELFKILTGESMNRDIDLDDWLDGIGFHPANTEAKQLGHELARTLVGNIGSALHEILPAGRDKSLAFKLLEDVLMRANRALALGGGPVRQDPEAVASMKRAIDSSPTELPQDPRIDEYKANQRARGDLSETSGPEYYHLEAEARLAQRQGKQLGDVEFTNEAIRAEVNAWLRYREARARGLSEYEAREDGWPSARPVDDVPLPQDDEDESAPRWRSTLTGSGPGSDTWVLDLEAKPGVVDIATVCRDPRNVAEVCQDFLAGQPANEDGPFNGFHVQMFSVEHLNMVLSEIAEAGQRAFGAEAVEPL